ncbi:MAG: TOMM precursor leader peptide-binding protein [Myxococcota bacterium]
MTARPRLKRNLRCVVVPDGVFLLSEGEPIHLRGRALPALVPLLDGRHTEDEIVDALAGRLRPAEVFYSLETLRRDRLVVDEDGAALAEGAFWDARDVPSASATQRVRDGAVALVRVGDAPGLEAAEQALRHTLTSNDVALADDGSLVVVLTDDFLDERIAEQWQTPRQVLLVRPLGNEPWLGPLFVPEQTGCWHCLTHRLRAHRRVEAYAERHRSGEGPSGTTPWLPSTLAVVAGLVATEITQWLACGESPLLGRVQTLDLRTFATQSHAVVRRPQCHHCGDAELVATKQRAPLVLESRAKIFTSDGGHRSSTPAQTVAALEHHVSPITGLIRRLRSNCRDESARLVTPSYVTDHNFAHLDDDGAFLRRSSRSRSGGKGRGDMQARASAICESIERYSGVFQGDEARRRATVAELGADAIEPNRSMLFSERQLDAFDPSAAMPPRYRWVPARFDPTQAIDWTPVWSLTHRTHRYLPTALCFFGYARAHGIDFATADSNGCAAGRSVEEAIVQGFLELVERDAVALWWYNRASRPTVELGDFGEPYLEQVRDYYATIDRELWVLDITSDLGIATFAAVSRRVGHEREDITLGFGCHLDPRIAILRAVTELNQILPAVYDGSQRHDLDPSFDPNTLGWWKTATLENQSYLRPAASAPARRRADYDDLSTDDVRSDIARCVGLAAERGLETLVLDQSRPDTGLAVVKVIVPGLRHFWSRFAAGRLFEVPVTLGWQPHVLTEDQLNPHSMYF